MWKIKLTLLSEDQVNIFYEWIGTGKNINSVKNEWRVIKSSAKIKTILFIFTIKKRHFCYKKYPFIFYFSDLFSKNFCKAYNKK